MVAHDRVLPELLAGLLERRHRAREKVHLVEDPPLRVGDAGVQRHPLLGDLHQLHRAVQAPALLGLDPGQVVRRGAEPRVDPEHRLVLLAGLRVVLLRVVKNAEQHPRLQQVRLLRDRRLVFALGLVQSLLPRVETAERDVEPVVRGVQLHRLLQAGLGQVGLPVPLVELAEQHLEGGGARRELDLLFHAGDGLCGVLLRERDQDQVGERREEVGGDRERLLELGGRLGGLFLRQGQAPHQMVTVRDLRVDAQQLLEVPLGGNGVALAKRRAAGDQTRLVVVGMRQEDLAGLLERRVEIPALQREIGERQPGVAVLGVDLERLEQRHLPLLPVLVREVGEREVELGRRVARCGFDGALEGLDGLVVLPPADGDAPFQDQTLRIAGMLLQQFLDTCGRLFGVARRQGLLRQQPERAGVAGVELEHRAPGRRRLGALALQPVELGQREVRVGVLRFGGGRGDQRLLRVVQPLPGHVEAGEQDVRLRFLRLQLHDALELRLGLVEPAEDAAELPVGRVRLDRSCRPPPGPASAPPRPRPCAWRRRRARPAGCRRRSAADRARRPCCASAIALSMSFSATCTELISRWPSTLAGSVASAYCTFSRAFSVSRPASRIPASLSCASTLSFFSSTLRERSA